LLGGQFAVDPPIQTIFLHQQHQYVGKNEIHIEHPHYHGLVEGSSWTLHHGLRNASQQAKDLVKGKEIFDVGSFRGDRLIILENYTNIRVRSYELIPRTAAVAQSYARLINPTKHIEITWSCPTNLELSTCHDAVILVEALDPEDQYGLD
jgi:hypothetical protein